MTSQFNFGSVPALNLASTTTSAFNFGPSTGQTTTLPSLGTTSGFTFATTANPLQSTAIGGFAPNPTLTLTLTTASTAVTQTSTQQTNAFLGLGGTQTMNSESSADQTLKTSKANKESAFIPPEMIPLVDALKQFVKTQKEIREENSQQRFSIQPILEVGSEIEDSLRSALHKIEVDIQRNSKAIDGLKKDTNKLLSSAEMAYRISRLDLMQTPSSYTIAQNKYINASTNQYFVEMVDNFELQMNNYSKQIQDLRTHIENMNKPYSSEELLQIMRKQHETLISLAAKVYAIHEDINQLKLSLRNQSGFSSRAVEPPEPQFRASTSSLIEKPQVGPNPFSLTGDDRPFGGSPQSGQETSQTTVVSQLPSFTSAVGSPFTPTVSTSVLPFSPSTTSTTSHSRAKRWTTGS